MEIGVKLMKQMDGEPRAEKVCRHLSIHHVDKTGRNGGRGGGHENLVNAFVS